MQLWTAEEVRVVCRRPPDLENHPDLALRVRGALGRRLAERGGPVAHRADPFRRPRAYDLLFEAGGHDAARPFALDVDVAATTVTVDLRLFGSAGFYVDCCREALVAALAGGIALRAHARHRVALEPLDCLGRRSAAALPPTRVGGAGIALVTPAVVRAGPDAVASPAALLRAAVTRVRRLADWYGVTLEADFAALRDLCAAAAVIEEDLVPFRSHRFSRRQPDRPIPIDGVLGRFAVAGDLAPLAPFLHLAEQTHLGSHAALGFGRVRVALWP